MKWVHEKDISGVPDHPDFDFLIHDYWINASGVRIGYFGRTKGATVLTYKGRGLWFCIDMHRSDPDGNYKSGKEYEGEVCNAYIKTDSFRCLSEEDQNTIQDDIHSFLLVYRAPVSSTEPLIKTAIIH